MYVHTDTHTYTQTYIYIYFPRSNLYFIELNISEQLLASQKTCFQLNQFGCKKTARDIKITLAPPADDVEVGQDQIHWTETTANKLYRC